MKERLVYANATAAENILKNNGIHVIDKTIEIDISSRLPGIKLWGAIDYLCRRHEYIWRKVDYSFRWKRSLKK